MRNSVATIILVAVLALVARDSWAGSGKESTLTESQVRNTCGKDLKSAGGAMGCTKPCGKQTCDYSCGGPGGKGCRGFVIREAGSPGRSKDLVATPATRKLPKGIVAPPSAGLLQSGSSPGQRSPGAARAGAIKNATDLPMISGGAGTPTKGTR